MTNRIPQNVPNPSLQGQLLVASEALRGTLFERTVVYVLQHNEDGVFGVVLNRPADRRLQDAWRAISGDTHSGYQHLSCGGPMSGPVFALHSFADLGELELNQGLFLSTTADAIQKIIAKADERYRIFFGIAGWRPGQLEQEINSGLWYRLGGDASVVFGDSSFLWERTLLSFGRNTAQCVLGVRAFPTNPLLN